MKTITELSDPARTNGQAPSPISLVNSWPANVADVQLAATTRQDALSRMGSPGAVGADDQQVLQFVVTGNFTVHMGADVGRGTYILATLDPKTGSVLDLAVTDRSMDVGALGTPLPVYPTAQE
jgi:hypothetical protein